MGNNSMFKVLEPIFSSSDDRGSIVQLFQGNCSQVNILHCKEGSVRGNHYHKINTESFYVVDGQVEVTLKTLDQNPIVETKIFSKEAFFAILPNISHEMFFKKDTVMVAVYDKGIILPDQTKDIYV